MKYLERLNHHLEGRGVIGTISGRYYAMDRDHRWERVRRVFDAIVLDAPKPSIPLEIMMQVPALRNSMVEHAPVATSENVFAAVAHAYEADLTDEFVEPVRIGGYSGIHGDLVAAAGSGSPVWEWQGAELALAFNFRADRMRQLSAMLLRRNLPPEVEKSLVAYSRSPIRAFSTATFVSLCEYDPALGMQIAFPKESVEDSFGEVISRAGLKQFRCAETEKYAHVTYFFNGGRESPFDGEDRKLVPSPRDVPTYDKKPEMSAEAVTQAVVEAIESDRYDFILVNYANPDMVGHTGVLDAATRAVEAVDGGIGAIRDAVLKKGGALIVTADHGNCETMVGEGGQPHTAHTTNPVPLYYVSSIDEGISLREGGAIADVAPTMLEILGIEQPEKMTGRSLRVPRAAG
jgi:2,3-bisphosphoglycerate-independent phosphoglycerate mutase